MSDLYRDPVNGKIAGVCAGLANYFGMEVWVVRILVISAFLLGGSFLVVLVYFAMTLMLEKTPQNYRDNVQSTREHTLKNKPWQSGQGVSELLATLERDFGSIENKIKNMEAYVTSESFKVNREFKNL
ncbi:phage shock protein C (PspC) family protein [Vibrio xiamenensis]|uniref:Phage shock protein C (PspC) family protein n=2 Tax=Vibrio xiamenensis TaxID=861298 RepID=A0A1G7WLT6_9VIBR|nr:envelope stress response membrane protein PspC [Vibrio xiamenensis]SDG72967.1 phage shock protein C (PspC) family protein [Vibrio xiamenensis]